MFCIFQPCAESGGEHGLFDRTSTKAWPGSLDLGISAFKRGNFKRAKEFFESDLNEAKEAGDKYREGKAYSSKQSNSSLGVAYSSLRDLKKTIKSHQQALSITKEIGDKELEGKAYINLGDAYVLIDSISAINFLQQAISIAELEGKAYSKLGDAYYFVGDPKKAIEFHHHALTTAKKIENKGLERKAYVNLENVYHFFGDHKKANEFHQKAISIKKEIGSESSEGKAYTKFSNECHSIGDPIKTNEFHQRGHCGTEEDAKDDLKKAIEFLQQVHSTAKAITKKRSEGQKEFTNLDNGHYFHGGLKKAIEFHQEALSNAKEIGNKESERNAYINLGACSFFLGDFPSTEEYFESSVKVAEEMMSLSQEKRVGNQLSLSM